MKMRVLAFVAIVLCTATYSVASQKTAQYIVTDCGTVHQIPDNSSDKFAVAMQEYWTSVDC